MRRPTAGIRWRMRRSKGRAWGGIAKIIVAGWVGMAGAMAEPGNVEVAAEQEAVKNGKESAVRERAAE